MSIAVFERRSAERQALEVKARTESEAQTAKLTNERDQQWREIGAIAATVVTAAAAVKVASTAPASPSTNSMPLPLAVTSQTRTQDEPAPASRRSDRQTAGRQPTELQELTSVPSSSAPRAQGHAQSSTASVGLSAPSGRPASAVVTDSPTSGAVTSGSVTPNSTNNKPTEGLPDQDGCIEAIGWCTASPSFELSGTELVVRFTNACPFRVYVSSSGKTTKKYDSNEADGVRPGARYTHRIYDATGEATFAVFGSTKASSDWVCAKRSIGTKFTHP